MRHTMMGDRLYLRLDRGDEVLSGVLEAWQAHGIIAGTFTGIAGCEEATVSTYLVEEDEFTDHTATGMLEMVSLQGNVRRDADGHLQQHAHATFSYLEDGRVTVLAGHLSSARIRYTGEIVLTPVQDGNLDLVTDPATGLDVWGLS